jgi:AcrR family transcriptional regulator
MTQKAPKDERVKEILTAAGEEFLEKGYEAATMDSIAKRAGLSKGALYHHFEGKDDILLAANLSYLEAMDELFAAAGRVRSPSKALLSYIKAYLAYWDENRRQVEFFFLTITKAMADERIWPYYRDYSARVTAFLDGLFRRGVEEGEFEEHDSRAAAVCLMGTLDGLLGYLIMDDTMTMDKILSSVRKVYIDSIRRAPAKGRKRERP